MSKQYEVCNKSDMILTVKTITECKNCPFSNETENNMWNIKCKNDGLGKDLYCNDFPDDCPFEDIERYKIAETAGCYGIFDTEDNNNLICHIYKDWNIEPEIRIQIINNLLKGLNK